MSDQLLKSRFNLTLTTDGAFRFEHRNNLCNGARGVQNEAILAKVWLVMSLPSGSARGSEAAFIGVIT